MHGILPPVSLRLKPENGVRSDPELRSDRLRFQHLGTFGGHFLAAAGAAGRGGGGAGRAIWGGGAAIRGGGAANRGGGAAIRGGGGAGLAICGAGRGGGGARRPGGFSRSIRVSLSALRA